MTDTEKIQAVLSEAMSGAGAMISVRTLCALIQWRLNEQPKPGVTIMMDFIDTIATTSNGLADAPERWTTKEGRYNFAIIPSSSQPLQTHIEVTLRKVIAKMATAYKDDFRVNGAVSFLRDIAKFCKVFQDDLKKEPEPQLTEVDDFVSFDELLKSGSVNKDSVWIDVDEDIVRVFAGDDIIFSAEPVHFVNAFFTLYGIDIDGNLEDRN